jgi:hypothetical protein
MQALVLDRQERASILSKPPAHRHIRQGHQPGARPLQHWPRTGATATRGEHHTCWSQASAVPKALGAPRRREGWQPPAAGQARTGAVCAWNAARRAFSVSALSSLRLTSGSPVTSSTPGVRGGANFSWYERPLAGWIQRPVTRSTYVRQGFCRSKRVASRRLKSTTGWFPMAAVRLHTHLART